MRKLRTMVAVVAMLCGSAMGTAVTDDFESYTPGAWDATEMAAAGWAYYDANTDGDIGTAYGRSGKGLLWDASNSAIATLGRASVKGRIDETNDVFTCYVNIQSMASSAGYVQLRQDNQANSFIHGVYFKKDWDGNANAIAVAGKVWTLLGTYTEGQWYRIDVQYDFPNNQARVRLDGGTWTAYGNFGNDRSAIEANTLIFSDNAVAWIDDVSVIPEPATLGMLVLGGMGLLARRRRNRS